MSNSSQTYPADDPGNMLVADGKWTRYAENYFQRSTDFDRMAEVYFYEPDARWQVRIWKRFKSHQPDRMAGRMERIPGDGFATREEAFAAGEARIG